MASILERFFLAKFKTSTGDPVKSRNTIKIIGNAIIADNPDTEETELTFGVPNVPGTIGQILTSGGDGTYGTPISQPPGGFIGANTTDNLGNKTLSSPIVWGVSTFESLAGSAYSSMASLVTSSTTAATLTSFPMDDETLCAFDVIVTCARKTNVTKGGRYKRSVVYRRTGGAAPTIVGSVENGTDQETTAGDNVTIDVSGNDVRVRVVAADSDPRNWVCELRVQETLAT